MKKEPKTLSPAELKNAAKESVKHHKVAGVFVTDDGNVFLADGYNAMRDHVRKAKCKAYVSDGTTLIEVTDEHHEKIASSAEGRKMLAQMMKKDAPKRRAADEDREEEEEAADETEADEDPDKADDSDQADKDDLNEPEKDNKSGEWRGNKPDKNAAKSVKANAPKTGKKK